MTLEKSDLESIKTLLEATSSAPQSGSPSALFDLEARDRIIQTNDLLKQQQATLEKSLDLIEKKLDVVEAILQKSGESAKLFDTRYASLARWLNHYQTWSILLAIATAASVILGLRYFPF